MDEEGFAAVEGNIVNVDECLKSARDEREDGKSSGGRVSWPQSRCAVGCSFVK